MVFAFKNNVQIETRKINRLPIIKKGMILLGIMALSLSITGCQSFQAKNPGELALENHAFISLWDTYNQCLVGTNTEEMQLHLATLHSAPTPISLDQSPIPVPNFLKNLASARNSRLAVDPRAMAAACSMRIAEVANQAADFDTALHTFQTIVENYPEPQYAFYVSKATQAIEQFSTARPVSLSSNNTLVR